MRKPIPLIAALAVGGALIAGAFIAAPGMRAAEPWPCDLPMGALPPAMPVWCMPATTGPSTFVAGANSWLDDFNHGLSMADLGAGYRTYEHMGSNNQTAHFRHNNHWMVDINGVDQDGPGPWNLGGAMMRPDKSFHFENGKLVVEAEVAAGVDAYKGNAWSELVVTTAPGPTHPRETSQDTYVYDQFAFYDTVGCRLYFDGGVVCALFDNTEHGPGNGGRTWEIQDFQSGGAATHYGGNRYTPERAAAFRICKGTDPDTNCRDKFRWEISKDRLALYVNGTLYMLHQGFPLEHQLPSRFLNSPVYTYFGERIYKPNALTVRYHWDHLAVNPELSGGITPTPTPSATPTVTPTVTPAPCEMQHRRLNADGTYTYSAWTATDPADCAGL